jgi:hypothetical protein
MSSSQEIASGADEGFQETLLMCLNHQNDGEPACAH